MKRNKAAAGNKGEWDRLYCSEDMREIYLFGDIEVETPYNVVMALRKIDRRRGKITILLSSSGGDLSAGWTIYEALRMTKNQVVIHAMAECMSAAALILQGGDKRLLSPETRLMVHNGSAGVEQNYNELLSYMDEYKYNLDRFHRVMKERSKLSLTRVKSMFKRDTYMSAQKAVEYGFADEVIPYPKKRRTR